MDILFFDEPYNHWLSNFFVCPVEYEGIKYLSSEAAYQASKCVDPEERFKFVLLRPWEAKKAGQRVKIRSDWNSIRIDVMYNICNCKFSQNPYLLQKLLETDGLLVEGNTWRDKFWGQVEGKGHNHLGKILMRLREEFREALKL